MSLAGEAVVAIWHDIATEGLEEFYAWHTQEHMPERVGIPGFLRGRRYLAVEGAPAFFNLYEALTPQVLSGQDYLNRLDAPTPWTLRTVPHFRNVARAIQAVRHSVGPGVGGYVMTRRFEAGAVEPAALIEALTAPVLEPLARSLGVTGVHLCETDAATSGLQTAEKAARRGGTDVPGLSLMVEGDRLAALRDACAQHANDRALREAGSEGLAPPAFYQLEFLRTKTAVHT